jgi:cyclopropane fatty-acyl-phospholipid synthase-like methyltransferase
MSEELIDFYRKHHASAHYGAAGHHKVKFVLEALEGHNVSSVLDFGAGAQMLGKRLATKYQVTSYDPAIPGIDVLPTRTFDATVSTDVLEHIPYEEIDEVIATLVRLTDKVGYHHIANFPAQLRLKDGRDAHLIQKEAAWWKDRFEAQGAVVTRAVDTGKFNGRDAVYACITFVRNPDAS